MTIKSKLTNKETVVTDAQWESMRQRGIARNFTVVPDKSVPADVKHIAEKAAEKTAKAEKSAPKVAETLPPFE
jgi:uncharacterized protein (UPF0147 family)